jgi:hypothetical protein
MRTPTRSAAALVLVLIAGGCSTAANECPKYGTDVVTKIVPPLVNMSLEHSILELGGDWPYDWQGGYIQWVRYQYPPAYCRYKLGEVVILSSDPIKLPE